MSLSQPTQKLCVSIPTFLSRGNPIDPELDFIINYDIKYRIDLENQRS